MDSRQLEVFAAVAEERSFTRAAQRLFAAQSTVSASVQALEAELGASLFERSTRQVALTPVGESVLVEAQAALDAIDRMRTAAAQSAAGLRGRVRFGFFTSLQLFVDLPALLGRFHRDHPLVNLRLLASPTGSTGLLDDIRHGRLDIALVALPDAELAGLDVIGLGSAPYVALLPATHPLARRGAHGVTIGELAGEAFVDTPVGFGNRVMIDRAFDALGAPRNVVAEVADLSVVPHYVREGLGIAVLPHVTEVPAGVAVVPLTPEIGWELSAVSRSGGSASPALDAVRVLLRERSEAAADASAAPSLRHPSLGRRQKRFDPAELRS